MHLNVNVVGLESLDTDLAAFQVEVAGKIQKAMDEVGADMMDALQKHIITDIYGAYSPKVYKRRSIDAAWGTPLSDMNANAYIFNKGAAVTLAYQPTGEHKNAKWHTADGDDLIGRIEKKSPAYTWGNEGVPERPFWQNFVNEMVDTGALDRFFAAAMAMQGEVITPDGVMRDPEDGAY